MDKQKISDFFSKNKNMKMFYIILIIGIVILLFSNSVFDNKSSDTKKSGEVNAYDIADKTKQNLEQILSEIRGAGKVEVMITYEGTAERYYAADISRESSESGSEGEKSGRTQSQSKQSSKLVTPSKEPIITKESYPKALGVIVVCEGGDDAAVKNNIISAVKSVLEVADHRVCVFAKK